MRNNHAEDWMCGGILNYRDGDADVKHAFHAAVGHLLPGQGGDFGIEMCTGGGAYGTSEGGAKAELVYLVYKPTLKTAGGHMDIGRGGTNFPWGHKRTPLPTLDAEMAKQVDAAFAVIAYELGLEAVGAPGMSLITTSSGG